MCQYGVLYFASYYFFYRVLVCLINLFTLYTSFLIVRGGGGVWVSGMITSRDVRVLNTTATVESRLLGLALASGPAGSRCRTN